jgi:hypothetical protein
MSSISKSIASPTRTVWCTPSSTISIGARSTPSISPTSGASPAIGPPIWPPNTPTSLFICSSEARSSTNTPSFQFPSVITLGVSAIATTLSPDTSVPSISPSLIENASTTRQ